MAGDIRLIGAVGIKVRPDTTGFKGEVEQQLRRLPEQFEIDVSADLTPLQRKLEKARKEVEAKQLNLKVGVEYDQLQAARRQVEAALKNLKTETIPVKLQEGDLNKALEKLKRLQRGAQVTMQFNEDRAGYEAALAKIRAIQREKAETKITFKTDQKSLEREARKYEKLLADLAPAKTITITHRNDNESLTKAVAQIDEALAKLKEVTITPQMNEEELLRHKDRLQKKLVTKPLVMKVTEDPASYEAVLKKIEALQQEAASAEFKFKTDEAGLAAAAAKVRAKIALLTPKPKITFSYDNDTFGLQRAVDEVDAKLKALGQIKLTADMDEAGLREAKAKLEKSLANSSFQLKVDENNLSQLEAERKKIEELLSKKNAKTILEVQNNQESLENAKRELDELIEARKAPIRADPITWEAAMQLAYASRARIVPFYVRVNEKSLAIAEGILKSLAGINVLRESGKFLENMVTKFDQVSIKAGVLLAIVGNLTNALTYMGTTLFSMGEGVFNAVGLLATMPAMLTAVTAGVLVQIAAWKNFKSAIDGDVEALAALPPAARETARAMRGMWDEMQRPAQEGFWEGMGEAMQAAMEAIRPILKTGLAGIARESGRFGAGVFRSLEDFAETGQLEKVLANVELMFGNASASGLRLGQALNIIGLRGSEYLPRFGTWINDITGRFHDWIKASDEAGKINVWIEQGVQSLKDMWTLSGGVIKMFQGIAVAAKHAGAGGLGDVAQRFSEIGDMMLREPFQSRLSRIFEGARTGASRLNVGVKELGLTVGEASLFVANLLSGLGELGGQALVGLSKTIGNLQFQSGVLAGLTGMNQMVVTLQDGFVDLGTVIGNLSRIAGAAFSSIAPIINQVIGLLANVTGTLAPSLINTVPGLMDLVGGLITALSGPVELIAQVLANILDFINGLGGPLQSIGLSLIAFLLLAGKIGPIFQARAGGLLEKIASDFQQADTARGKFQAGLKGIGAGMLAAVGGPWGLAIGAITTGLALAGQASADAQARVDEYTASLDQNTGAITRNTKALAGKNLLDRTNPWDDFWRSTKSTQEIIDTLGLSFEKTANMAAEGGPAYDALLEKLKLYPGTSGKADASMQNFQKALGLTDAEMSKLSRGDIVYLIQRLQEVNGETSKSKDGFNHLNDSTSKTNQRVQDLNAAMGVYNDKSATADQRTRALKTALDILSGKQPTIEEAQLRVNDAMRAAGGELQNVDGQMVKVGGVFLDAAGKLKNFNGVIDKTTGVINTQSEAGASLYRNLKDVTLGHLEVATQMKDAQKPVADITKYLADSRQAYIDQGVAAGLSGDLVAAAYDHMIGANPRDLITTITAQGVEEAEGKVKNYQSLLDQINGRRAVATIAGDDIPLGISLGMAYTKLSEWDKAIGTATAKMDPTQALAVRAQLEEKLIALANSDPTVRANMDPALLERKLQEQNQKLDDLARRKPSPEVDAEVAQAQMKLQMIQNMLSQIKSKEITVKTNYVVSQNGTIGDLHDNDRQMLHGGILNGAGVQKFANGGFFNGRPIKQFATGGFENHTAQIARGAVPYRVWAEPETGGEAYIPLAMSKRGRSTQILAQVAQQFGFTLQKAQAFADGGVVSGGNSKATGGLQVHIGTFNQNANDTIEDVGRGIMRGARTAGLAGTLEGL